MRNHRDADKFGKDEDNDRRETIASQKKKTEVQCDENDAGSANDTRGKRRDNLVMSGTSEVQSKQNDAGSANDTRGKCTDNLVISDKPCSVKTYKISGEDKDIFLGNILDCVREKIAMMMGRSTKHSACITICGRGLSIELLQPDKTPQTRFATSPAGSASVSVVEISDCCEDNAYIGVENNACCEDDAYTDVEDNACCEDDAYIDVEDNDSDESFDANEFSAANETDSESEEDELAALEAQKKIEELKSYLMARVVPDTDFDEDRPIMSADILGIEQIEEVAFDAEQVVDDLVVGWSCVVTPGARKRVRVEYLPPAGFAPINEKERFYSKPDVVRVPHASFVNCIVLFFMQSAIVFIE